MEKSFCVNLKRYLTIETNGKSTRALLSIESIKKQPAKKRWLCVWSLEHLCPRGIAIGTDPIETTINVIKLIGLFIHGTESDGINIWWKTRGDNGGFPVIKELGT